MLYLSAYPPPCEFSFHIGSFHLCSLFVSCPLGGTALYYPGGFQISFGVSSLAMAPASLCHLGI